MIRRTVRTAQSRRPLSSRTGRNNHNNQFNMFLLNFRSNGLLLVSVGKKRRKKKQTRQVQTQPLASNDVLSTVYKQRMRRNEKVQQAKEKYAMNRLYIAHILSFIRISTTIRLMIFEAAKLVARKFETLGLNLL